MVETGLLHNPKMVEELEMKTKRILMKMGTNMKTWALMSRDKEDPVWIQLFYRVFTLTIFAIHVLSSQQPANQDMSPHTPIFDPMLMLPPQIALYNRVLQKMVRIGWVLTFLH